MKTTVLFNTKSFNFIIVVLFVLAMQIDIIDAEEQINAEKFGNQWTEYKRKVRLWF